MKIFFRYFQIHGFVGTEPGDMDENRVLALFHACPSTLQSSFRYFHTLNYALKLVFLVLVLVQYFDLSIYTTGLIIVCAWFLYMY